MENSSKNSHAADLSSSSYFINHVFATFITAICTYKKIHPLILLVRHQAEIDSPDKAKQASDKQPLIVRNDGEAKDRRQGPHFQPRDHNRPEILKRKIVSPDPRKSAPG